MHKTLPKRPPHGSSVEQRYEFYLNKLPGQGPSGDCWTLRTSRPKRNRGRPRKGTNLPQYPMLRDGYGNDIRVTRWVLERELGRSLLEGMQALHTCDFPPCVRPHHLFEGTVRDNVMDCLTKGRNPMGAAQIGNLPQTTKLSQWQVDAIRRGWELFKEDANNWHRGKPNLNAYWRELKKSIPISSTSLYDIIHFRTWKEDRS